MESMVIKTLMLDTTNTFPEQILLRFAIPTFINLVKEMRGQGRTIGKRDESKSQSNDKRQRETDRERERERERVREIDIQR